MRYSHTDIGQALKEARQRKGLSQREASRLSGIHQYQISKIENGSVDLRLSTLIQLARSVDLELKLVPRKFAPAVDSLARGAAHPSPPPAYTLDDEDDGDE